MKKIIALFIFLKAVIPGTAQNLTDGEYMIKINQSGKYLSLIHI